MFLGEFERPITSVTVHNMLREHFGYDFPVNQITVQKAKAVFEEICIQINKFRTSDRYFVGERDARYLSMLATARFLTEYLRDKGILLEAPNDTFAPYQKGIGTGIAHGVDTGVKFVPHVAGSAIGAFVGGLKGQALQSDQGRVKVAEIDIDTEFSKHFSEFKNPKDQKVIKQYMKYLKNAGKQGKLFTAKEIDDQMTKLPGNPFKGTVNPELRQKTVAEFMEINKNGAEVKNGPPTNKTERPKATPIMFDVVSALQNQQYTKEMAIDAVETAIKKNKSLMNDFDGLFKAALNKN